MSDVCLADDMVDVRWIWLFLHHEVGEDGYRSARADAAWAFWAQQTGQQPSPARGTKGEFTTLVPAEGDGWIKLQRTGSGDGIHLDLVVEDVDAAAEEAVGLGATLVDRYARVRVLRSPGGFVFCFTDWDAEGRPSLQLRTGDELVDQACLDIPAPRYADEIAFWSTLTGWEAVQSTRAEFRALRRPESLPVRVLLQRLEDAAVDEPVTGHVDVACDDRAAATPRWEDAGADVVAQEAFWTVLRDPAGVPFCLTDRDPQTGLLPGPG
ncbi:VOC family protein [Janibacter alkaliphilus]|uniref:Glyoxalase-like domain-containing protein n=1 Tax=Janibacter alkaliphilus TaxID=1069963 RepID=A0A852X8J1_9MICO|nr:VOC family protein [Janibacter alkaliphilus]NYG37073.1 hypothetical protein [Janibacter alkaliphilus]